MQQHSDERPPAPGSLADNALKWDGDVEPGYRPERVAPNEHGRYSIGAYNYTWCYAPASETGSADGLKHDAAAAPVDETTVPR